MSVPLANLLPAPKFAKGGGGLLNAPKFPTIDDVRSASTATEPPASMALTVAGSRTQAPPYGKRKGFVPRVPEDFGDGGAFPEIHIPQFPLFMGRKDAKAETRIVPISVDGDGKVKYDAILRQNMRKDQHLYSSFTDIIERTPQASELQRPSREEEEKLAEKTRAALGQLVDKAVTSAQATNIKKENREATFIRYTPQQALANDAHNSGAKQRIIRVQEMPIDPLEPPKFKHAKAPPAPGSPPVPVLHSPPRKLTAQDQQSWKIPPCISNWKNIKGYTVPLHQRMAADGRGLTEVKVNPAFAKLTESLYTAEQIARQEIEERAKLQKKLSQRRQQAKEEELRTLAQKAHEERAAAMGERDEAEDEADIEARAEREAVRREREQEIKREQRMERMKEDRRQAAMGKGPTKVRNDEDRDVSEKIALGQLPQTSKDSMFDQRLFNQNQGMSAGFNNDEAYDLYDKPLFNQQKSTYIYRGDKGGDTDTYGGEDSGAGAANAGGGGGGGGVSSLLEKSANATKFQPDRGFKGAGGAGGAGGRSKPVEFEKEKPSGGDFGFDQLFSGGDKSKERRPDALDSIGKRGHMSSIGGSSHGQEYSGRHQGSREMEFSESAEKYGSVAGQGGVRRGRDGDTDDMRDDSSSKRSRR